MNLLQTVLILLTASGTSATTLWHKGLRGVGYGTCSGTQTEHPMVDIYVPDVEVEQEHNWNGVGCCSETTFIQCSGVPVARATPLDICLALRGGCDDV